MARAYANLRKSESIILPDFRTYYLFCLGRLQIGVSCTVHWRMKFSCDFPWGNTHEGSFCYLTECINIGLSLCKKGAEYRYAPSIPELQLWLFDNLCHPAFEGDPWSRGTVDCGGQWWQTNESLPRPSTEALAYFVANFHLRQSVYRQVSEAVG